MGRDFVPRPAELVGVGGWQFLCALCVLTDLRIIVLAVAGNEICRSISYAALTIISVNLKEGTKMRENKVRSIVASGGAVINGWLGIPSSFAAEVMAHTGFDSLTIDMQHGAMH